MGLPRRGTISAAMSQASPKARPAGAGENMSSASPVTATGQGSSHLRARPSLCAAVCQARRLRFDMAMRQRASQMALRDTKASQGSSARRRSICRSRPVRPWGVAERRRSRSRRSSAVPSAGSTPVHSESSASSPAQSEAAAGTARAQMSAARQKGAKRLRRRLSKSFHLSAKAKFRPRLKMKPMFCQSPRTQRCWRRKYAPGLEGKPSVSSVSLM